jgi:hypothetical protein
MLLYEQIKVNVAPFQLRQIFQYLLKYITRLVIELVFSQIQVFKPPKSCSFPNIASFALPLPELVAQDSDAFNVKVIGIEIKPF